MAQYEIRLSGAGGQGIILAGIILAEAAAIFEDKEAIQTQSYGPEARGGSCKSEVIISDHEIDYPKVTRPDLLLAMTQESANKYAGDIKEGGIVIFDSHFVTEEVKTKGIPYYFPITELARDTLKKEITANIIALGTLVGLSGIVSREALENAVLDRVPPATRELNLKAIELGLEQVNNLLKPSGIGISC